MCTMFMDRSGETLPRYERVWYLMGVGQICVIDKTVYLHGDTLMKELMHYLRFD